MNQVLTEWRNNLPSQSILQQNLTPFTSAFTSDFYSRRLGSFVRKGRGSHIFLRASFSPPETQAGLLLKHSVSIPCFPHCERAQPCQTLAHLLMKCLSRITSNGFLTSCIFCKISNFVPQLKCILFTLYCGKFITSAISKIGWWNGDRCWD